MRRGACLFGTLTAALLMLFVAGLGWFIASGLMMRGDPAAATDAIVVLTGGKQRLETGIELLAAGKAKKLFISGVNPQVDSEELLHALGPTAAHEACCIVLGHQADNTFENAQETAAWARAEGYSSLRLVTGWYHMRRSLLEFGRAMPEATIVPQPVFAAHAALEGWWGRRGAAALVVGEYGKYLVALLRSEVDAVLPPPAPGPTIRTTVSRAGAAEARR